MDCTSCGACPGKQCFDSCPALRAKHPLLVLNDNGKTLRDEFAMAALTKTIEYFAKNYADRTIAARVAYEYADAMMKARDGE